MRIIHNRNFVSIGFDLWFQGDMTPTASTKGESEIFVLSPVTRLSVLRRRPAEQAGRNSKTKQIAKDFSNNRRLVLPESVSHFTKISRTAFKISWTNPVSTAISKWLYYNTVIPLILKLCTDIA
jgi:hypothetical protein